MKYNKGNKAVTQSLSNGAHSLMKDVKQVKETVVATKKKQSERLTNEQWPYKKSNNMLKTRRRVIKKPS